MSIKIWSVAVLYQAQAPPAINGISKPMKPGGYADSGADIAFALQQAGLSVVTPVNEPDPEEQGQWVFPDTSAGIQRALDRGARVFWLNTVLFAEHPIGQFLQKGIWVVGQDLTSVEKYDDKWLTNELLRQQGLPVPTAIIIDQTNLAQLDINPSLGLSFPVVAKPIRGRGSAGVTLVETPDELRTTIRQMLDLQEFGDAIMVETYLPGQEVTLTVMPPGTYIVNGEEKTQADYWSLPPVKRFNHHNGVAPYNGTVAVTANSQVLDDYELASPAIQTLMKQCELAARLVHAKALIRIDCRQDAEGKFYLFDLNMKPNLTGAGRPGRSDQDSLTTMAAATIGWSYQDLVVNILRQAWSIAD
jgi:D-alanine-D-alanine ligase